AWAAARALDIPARVVMGFVEAEFTRLTAVVPDAEGAMAMYARGGGGPASPTVPAPPRLSLTTEPLSPFEERFALIPAAHVGTSLGDAGQVLAWRRAAEATSSRESICTSHGHGGGLPLDDAITRPRSTPPL